MEEMNLIVEDLGLLDCYTLIARLTDLVSKDCTSICKCSGLL